MRFLVLTKKFPYPPKDGESLLISNFYKSLKSHNHKIDILSFNTIKHYFKISELPENDNPYDNIWEIYLDNRVKLLPAFFNLFSIIPYNISRFINKNFENKLIEILTVYQYDVIIFESIFLHPYLEIANKYSSAKKIMRAHNVEFEIWQRLAINEKNSILKFYKIHLAQKLKKYEFSAISDYDKIIALTERDLKTYMKYSITKSIMLLPAGINNIGKSGFDINIDEILKISFIGSLDWMPNIEGLNWFIENCWHKNNLKAANIELHIAGRNTPEWLVNLNEKNIFIHGEVEDSAQFLSSFPVMIVPLLSGGGMRLKILEAMSLGRVVISTKLGFEGIDAIDNEHILAANTPEEFIEKINFCSQNSLKIQTISKNAKELFTLKYEINSIVSKFLNSL
jgi:hypothetical protein